MTEWTAGTFSSPRFALENGGELPNGELANIYAVTLDANGGNAIPGCLVSLGRAIGGYQVGNQLHRTRTRVLLALSDIDRISLASEGPEAVRRLRNAGVDTRYAKISSRFGQLASELDWQLWEPELRTFVL